jgi:hypothetical protein
MIYDLFAVVDRRNPYKTAHEIARSLNSNIKSPFYRRLKMLGKKTKGSNETLSQGTFVTFLLPHISSQYKLDFDLARSNKPMISRPESIFNNYYVEDKDEIIVKILLNLFSALRDVFPEQWENPEKFILTKTTGYTGVMKALDNIFETGKENQDLSYNFFLRIFMNFRKILSEKDLSLTSKDFPPNSSGESKLRNILIEACTLKT